MKLGSGASPRTRKGSGGLGPGPECSLDNRQGPQHRRARHPVLGERLFAHRPAIGREADRGVGARGLSRVPASVAGCSLALWARLAMTAARPSIAPTAIATSLRRSSSCARPSDPQWELPRKARSAAALPASAPASRTSRDRPCPRPGTASPARASRPAARRAAHPVPPSTYPLMIPCAFPSKNSATLRSTAGVSTSQER